MPRHKSKSPASGTERPRLAPPWALLTIAALILLALVLAYPQKDLIQRLSQAPAGELSDAYLDNLLRSTPNDPQLRLLVAARALRKDETASLQPLLQPLLDSKLPELRREALWLLWQADAAGLRKLPATAVAERRARSRDLSARLAQLSAEDWPDDRLLTLAEQAFAIGDTADARQLYRKGAARLDKPGEAAAHYAQGAATALTHGDYRSSAELALLASAASTERGDARRYRLQALRTLQSGNLLAEAVAMAEREVGEQESDPETLYFVVQLARAAGRPDIADRYVRRLLRLSLLRQLERIRLVEAHAGAWPQKASLREAPAGGPQLPFDDKTYTLGYEVFLENRKLDDAWKVAASAVRQVPDDDAWRERLARVAEWTGRPAQALDNWLHVARRTQRDEAWQAVLRLAPGLLDDRALLAALQYQIARQPDDLALYRQAVAAWERLGEPLAALAYLETRSRNGNRAPLLELMADLADRAGDPGRALQLWRRLFEQRAEITPERAVRAATLAALLDQAGEGLRWLEIAALPTLPASVADRDRLRLTGQLALREQRAEEAVRIYALISESHLAEEADFDALIALSSDTSPQTAARAALTAWERFRQPRYLLRALGLYAGSGEWPAFGQVLARFAPDARPPYDTLPDLRRDAEFLRLSAAYHQHSGRLPAARRDLTAALALAPRSEEIRNSLLWLLIDSNDAPGLRRFLATHEPGWRANPAMHDGLAAAYLALSRPKVALERYLTPHFAEHQDDFLWLMNYADALEQNQQTDRAWRLRRSLLQREWRNRGKRWLDDRQIEEVRRLARARLTMQYGNGDRGLDVLRQVLRLDREGTSEQSPAVAEMLLGWLQQAGEYSAERAYLWQQAARALGKPANRPLWAEISVALAEDDRSALHALLDRHGERLPRYDRIRAATVTDAEGLAQSDAFETQEAQDDDDPLHMQLAESLLAFSDHAGGSAAYRQLGVIDELLASARSHVALSPRLAMDLELGEARRRVRDAGALGRAPDETFASLRIAVRHDDGQTGILLERRHSLDDYTPLQIEHVRRLDDRLSLRLGLGHQLPSPESVTLRVAGMKDRAYASLSYQPTRLDRITVEQVAERYKLQTGSAVGRGTHTNLIAAHALRQESRDFEISAFWSAHRFDREASYSDPALASILPATVATVGDLGPDFFLPDSFNYSGLRLSTDMRHEEAYTRALRPYGSIARTWHSTLGPGYDLRVGIAGSVFGADHFSLTWGLGKAGVQVGGQTREIQLNYRLHY